MVKLEELQTLVKNKCDNLGQSDIAYMLEMKRHLQDSKKKTEEALETLKPGAKTYVLDKVVGFISNIKDEEEDVLGSIKRERVHK